MRKHINGIGLLLIGLCVGAIAGYLLRGDEQSATAVTSYRQPRTKDAPIPSFDHESSIGRIVLGGSVNSDLGVAGHIILEERNFGQRGF